VRVPVAKNSHKGIPSSSLVVSWSPFWGLISTFQTVSRRSTLAIWLHSKPHQPTDPSMPRDFLRVGVRGRHAKSL
jgi:hypothetical protein